MNKKAKFTAIIIAAGIVINMAFPSMNASAEPMPCPGDANADTVINIDDVMAILEHYAKTSAGLGGTLTDNFGIVGGDTDANGKIDIVDASNVLTYYAFNAACLEPDRFPVYQVVDNAIAAYKPVVEQFLSQYSDSSIDPEMGPRFEIANIDNDYIPELILSRSQTHVNGTCMVYTYVDGQLKLIDDNFGYCGQIKYSHSNDPTGHGTGYIVDDKGYTGYRCVNIYYLYRGELTKEHYITMDYINNKFTIDGNDSTESKCDDLIESYDAMEIGRACSSIDEYWFF